MTDLAAGTGPAGPIVSPVLAPRRRFMLLRRLLAHRSFQIGATLVVLLTAAAVLAPLITGLDPVAMKVRFRFRPPSAVFPFGTDNFGRDILTRVVYGARVSLWIGLVVTLLSGFLGAAIGMIAAQFRSVDAPLMRVMDALMSFPAILLALGITAALGPRMESVIIALTVAYVPAGVRIVRASALVVRELDYVQAARIAGAGNARIMFRHILPNSVGPLLVHMTFVFAYSILAEAALSFLGVGVPPPTPSWGNIIAEGRDYATEAWWVMLFPGIAISLAALGLNLLGDGLRDVLDPRLKGAG
jgi:peptide/nickel transport system permease protein